MTPFLVSFLSFLVVFGIGYLATRLRKVVPEHHLSADTKDTVKLAMGLVATMTALVLGLLVASAKGSFDAQKQNVIRSAAQLMILDRTLSHYGPEAAVSRQALRQAVQDMVIHLWPSTKFQSAELNPNTAEGDAVYDSIQALGAADDNQRSLKSQALSLSTQVGEDRWLLYEQSGSSISIPLLSVVVCWLAILFFSFGLFAPPNNTALGALLVSALSVAAALFLILELDHPFDGLIHISSGPMQIALTHLGS